MRNFRSLVLGLLLAILSPLGWGEDVWYCSEERVVQFEYKDGQLKFLDFPQVNSFGLRIDQELNSIILKYENQEPLEGDVSFVGVNANGTGTILVTAQARPYRFSLNDNKFYMSTATWNGAEMRAGTCTKF